MQLLLLMLLYHVSVLFIGVDAQEAIGFPFGLLDCVVLEIECHV